MHVEDPRSRRLPVALQPLLPPTPRQRTEPASHGARARPRSWLGMFAMRPDNHLLASRIRFLRIALKEAVRSGDKEAAKRLTARLMNLSGGDIATLVQARTH